MAKKTIIGDLDVQGAIKHNGQEISYEGGGSGDVISNITYDSSGGFPLYTFPKGILPLKWYIDEIGDYLYFDYDSDAIGTQSEFESKTFSSGSIENYADGKITFRINADPNLDPETDYVEYWKFDGEFLSGDGYPRINTYKLYYPSGWDVRNIIESTTITSDGNFWKITFPKNIVPCWYFMYLNGANPLHLYFDYKLKCMNYKLGNPSSNVEPTYAGPLQIYNHVGNDAQVVAYIQKSLVPNAVIDSLYDNIVYLLAEGKISSIYKYLPNFSILSNLDYLTYNGMMTIQQNGKQLGYFTANQRDPKTINITTPVKYSDLVDDKGFTGYTKLTYDELVTLRNEGRLQPGWKYQITDYVCTTTTTNTASANHKFDIIVTAIKNNALSEEAEATYHFDQGTPAFAPGTESGDINIQYKVCIDETGDMTTYEVFDPDADPEEGTDNDWAVVDALGTVVYKGQTVPSLNNPSPDGDASYDAIYAYYGTTEYLDQKWDMWIDLSPFDQAGEDYTDPAFDPWEAGFTPYVMLSNQVVVTESPDGYFLEREVTPGSTATFKPTITQARSIVHNYTLTYDDEGEFITDYEVNPFDIDDHNITASSFGYDTDGTPYFINTEKMGQYDWGDDKAEDADNPTKYRFVREIQYNGQTWDMWVEGDNDASISGTVVYWLTNCVLDVQRQLSPLVANANLAAWKIKYCLDNDPSRFAWADMDNGKGVIYYMKDEWNNEAPYDFKNILYKTVTADTAEDSHGRYTFNYMETSSSPSVSLDASMNNYWKSGSSHRNRCLENCIKPYLQEVYGSDTKYRWIQYLNDIRVIGRRTGVTASSYSEDAIDRLTGNKFDSNCHNIYINAYGFNEFDQGCYDINIKGWGYNKFGRDSNTINVLESSSYNTVGRSCYSLAIKGRYNVFGDNCDNISLEQGYSAGDRILHNVFEDKCSNITLGNNTMADIKNNHFGYGSKNITLNYGSHNKFGVCTNTLEGVSTTYTITLSGDENVFADRCYNITALHSTRNTFGEYCNNLNLADYSTRIIFGKSCSNITFGTSASSLSNYVQDVTFEPWCAYIFFTSDDTTASSTNQIQNVHVEQTVRGTSANNRLTISVPDRGLTYLTTYRNNASVTVDLTI